MARACSGSFHTSIPPTRTLPAVGRNSPGHYRKSPQRKAGTGEPGFGRGDFDTAIAQLTEATQTDANRDLLWFKLADAYRSSAAKQTDPQEKAKRYDLAVTNYQKAVDLKQKAIEANATKNPTDSQT